MPKSAGRTSKTRAQRPRPGKPPHRLSPWKKWSMDVCLDYMLTDIGARFRGDVVYELMRQAFEAGRMCEQ